jgi:endonuclease-3
MATAAKSQRAPEVASGLRAAPAKSGAASPLGGDKASRQAGSARKPRTPAGRARLTAELLAAEYPGSERDLIELDFSNPWELLVATVLSAQTTDVRVNSVTPLLFKRYPTAEHLACADPLEVEELVRPTGFFRVKAKTLVAVAQALCERFGGEVPASMGELVALPGVGRKTANVVLSVAFGIPGLPVDTHVARLSRLLGLSAHTSPEKIEADLCAALPAREWGAFSLRMILHGRRVCIANSSPQAAGRARVPGRQRPAPPTSRPAAQGAGWQHLASARLPGGPLRSALRRRVRAQKGCAPAA